MERYEQWLALVRQTIFQLLLMVVLLTVSLSFILYVLPKTVAGKLETDLFGYQWSDNVDDEQRLSNIDYTPIWTDHTAIVDWVAQCMGAKDVSSLPYNLRNIFEVQYYFVYSTNNTTPIMPTRDPTSYERSVLHLSAVLFTSRALLTKKAERSYVELGIATVISIVIGFITTVVVSISTTEFGKGDSGYAKTIRFFAIFFPALGTAVAAIIAFYSPREDLTRASNTLAGFVQLHGQMALDILTLPCGDPAHPASADMTDKLTNWRKRFSDIQALAEPGNSSGTSSGESPSRSGGNGQPGGGRSGEALPSQ